MFTVDVLALRQFYASPLGGTAARCILAAIRRLWTDCKRDSLVAIGYSLPYIEALRADAEMCIALMLAEHGAIYWPADGANRTVLGSSAALPLPDARFNRVLAVHALEHARHLDKKLDEIWRILVPGGRALLIVPNRIGIWAHAVSTPFGCGQPYSVLQLGRLIGEKQFTLTGWTSALYPPPLTWRWVQKAAPAIEFLGRLFFPGTGGVLLVEIEKQIYASIPEPVRSPVAEALYPAGTPAITMQRIGI